MLLGITHKSNQMASNLIAFLETKGDILSINEMRINEIIYNKILVKCGDSATKYFINYPQAIGKSLDSEHKQQILNINKILYNEMVDESIAKTYKVLVFERSVLSVRQRVHGKTYTRPKYIEEDQCKKIADSAKRVIYLLGLDYGMVRIGLTGSKKVRIISVDDSPLLKEFETKKLFAELIKVIETASKFGSKEVKMGADPEFMLSNARNGHMIPASQFFPREGIVGCDSIRMPNRQQRPIAELRPKPDNSPLQLFLNLDQALRTASKLAPYRNIKWLAGSRPFSGYSVGGHIHFSNIDLNNHILRALDSYIALPLFLIENQVTAVKRRDKYGFLADYRAKEYGGFEYRTPASWLVSPKIAAATLCLGKIVASNYLMLTRNCFLTAEAQRAFYDGDQESLRNLFNDLWSDIEKTAMYEEYKGELQIIYDMVKDNLKWEEKEDIRKTWAISILPRKKNGNTKTEISAAQNSLSSSRNISTTPAEIGNSSRNDNRSVNSSNGQEQRNVRFSRPSPSGPVFTSSQSFFN